MNSRCRNELSSYLREIKNRYVYQTRRLKQLDDYTGKRMKAKQNETGGHYYYIFDAVANKYQYLGKESIEYINMIKEAHFLLLSTKELKREINLIEKIMRQSRNVDYDSINRKLCPTYRDARLSKQLPVSAAAKEWQRSMENYKKTFPPFKPEELKQKTHDGNYVRSLGEALIYNYLLDIGVAFVYELPLKIRYNNKDALLLPDFTILSEIDFKTVIFIEHQGMMTDLKYRDKFNDMVYKYWLNNYLPERDVFFTFSSPNGSFDDSPIKSIISRYIRPDVSPSLS